MANDSLNYSVSTINLSLKQYDLLVESISKINALVQVAMLADLEEISRSDVLHYYLWTLRDVIDEVSDLCKKLEPNPTAKPKLN